MATIILSVFFLFSSILIHLILCRKDNDKSLKAKLFVQITLTALGLFLAIGFGARLPYILTSAVIYVLLVPVYLIFYVSTELYSPSKRILHAVGMEGAAYSKIFKELEQENFIMTRLEELEQSGCLTRKYDRYALSKSGWSIAKVLYYYQKLLGREIGG
jgi:hypothetical protein